MYSLLCVCVCVCVLYNVCSYGFPITNPRYDRDADFIFYTIMEYQKHCTASTPDAAKANQTFMATVISKFTPEAFHTLRRYMTTMPEVKSVISLQLRAQKITDAGVTMARRAIGRKGGDSREKQIVLSVRRICLYRTSEFVGRSSLCLNFTGCRRRRGYLAWEKRPPSTNRARMIIWSC
jgi:hypothetical protein